VAGQSLICSGLILTGNRASIASTVSALGNQYIPQATIMALREYISSGTPSFITFNLETAVGREKDVQDIDVHGKFEKRVVTLLVMSAFS
jgi:hypothetical protein